jgi:hypothetical protein
VAAGPPAIRALRRGGLQQAWRVISAPAAPAPATTAAAPAALAVDFSAATFASFVDRVVLGVLGVLRGRLGRISGPVATRRLRVRRLRPPCRRRAAPVGCLWVAAASRLPPVDRASRMVAILLSQASRYCSSRGAIQQCM